MGNLKILIIRLLERNLCLTDTWNIWKKICDKEKYCSNY